VFGVGGGACFGHNGSRGILYTNCIAGLGYIGFNSEVSDEIVMIGCKSGGRSAPHDGNPYSLDTVLGNSTRGFVINGSNIFSLMGCIGDHNVGAGLAIVAATGIKVIGGSLSYNNRGIEYLDGPSVAETEVIGVLQIGNAH
jgi:hypothetical protein